jgi:hypothetical protein
MLHRHRLSARFSFTIGSFVFTTLLAGCSDITVTSRYGPDVKLSGLGSTYSWAPPPPSGAVVDRSLGGAEFQQAVRSALEQQLAAKGFKAAPEGAVDFWVDYRLAKKLETDTGVVPSGEAYMEISLTLDVKTPATGQLIWRGVARTKLNTSNPPAVRKQRLAQAARELMKAFPPK